MSTGKGGAVPLFFRVAVRAVFLGLEFGVEQPAIREVGSNIGASLAQMLGAKRDATSASAVEKVLSYWDHGQQREEQMTEMVTLDAVLAGERVHFIKVDTDGSEFEVLRGAANTLKESRPSLHLEFATYLIPEPLLHTSGAAVVGVRLGQGAARGCFR